MKKNVVTFRLQIEYLDLAPSSRFVVSFPDISTSDQWEAGSIRGALMAAVNPRYVPDGLRPLLVDELTDRVMYPDGLGAFDLDGLLDADPAPVGPADTKPMRPVTDEREAEIDRHLSDHPAWPMPNHLAPVIDAAGWIERAIGLIDGRIRPVVKGRQTDEAVVALGFALRAMLESAGGAK